MKLFKVEPRLGRKSGDPAAPELVETGWICDLCGKAHTVQDDEDGSGVAYTVVEEGGAEPSFHEFRVEGYPKIDPYQLFRDDHSNFRYCFSWSSGASCEEALILAAVTKGLGRSFLLCNLLFDARCRMLKKVLDEGRFQLWQLGLDDPPDPGATGAGSIGGMEELDATQFVVVPVVKATKIKDLLQNAGLAFKSGHAFYQLGRKKETIGPDKQIILKQGNKLFSGAAVRTLLKLPAQGQGSAMIAAPPGFSYIVFVQSTSNRQLVAGTSLIYRK